VLENKNMNHLHSERFVHFSNVNSLMRFSLGLIFFTIISTSLVYAESISVDTDVTSFDIPYTPTGMTIIGIESDPESMSLIFFVDVTDLNGNLDVILDRSFFDSVYDDIDYDFFILSDGDEAVFEETETNTQSRTLSITVPSGTEDLEIIGSFLDNSLPIFLINSNEEPIVEEPIVEEPIVEEPIVEEPIVEEPIVENTPNNECGPGTILENGVCVLDQRCGPGTILEDGACVLDSTPVKSSSGNSNELIKSVTITLLIAGAIGIILALISKTNRNKN